MGSLLLMGFSLVCDGYVDGYFSSVGDLMGSSLIDVLMGTFLRGGQYTAIICLLSSIPSFIFSTLSLVLLPSCFCQFSLYFIFCTLSSLFPSSISFIFLLIFYILFLVFPSSLFSVIFFSYSVSCTLSPACPSLFFFFFTFFFVLFTFSTPLSLLFSTLSVFCLLSLLLCQCCFNTHLFFLSIFHTLISPVSFFIYFFVSFSLYFPYLTQ